MIDREAELEKFNRDALKIARKVADDTGTLMAGNISNTGTFIPNDPESEKYTRGVFKVTGFLSFILFKWMSFRSGWGNLGLMRVR